MSHLRLFVSGASPFALKTILLARELQVFQKLTLDATVVANPTLPHTSHDKLVPHGKIPALVVDGKTAIFGSNNICAYLTEISELKPSNLENETVLSKFQRLTTEAIADGIMEAVLTVRYERLSRPEALRWPEWVDGHLSKVHRSIPVLAALDLPDPVNTKVLGADSIAIAIALWYVDKRAPDANWRDQAGGEKLDKWCKAVMERKSWKDTTFGM